MVVGMERLCGAALASKQWLRTTGELRQWTAEVRRGGCLG
jgi:hypothetical protein